MGNFAATNAFAQQQAVLPPGYAYFYGQIPNQIQAAYGAGAASGLYPATAMAVPPATGGNNSSFKQNYSTQSYGSGYDTSGLGQGNKDFGASSYQTASNQATGKSSGATGSSGAGGAGHQYWGNTNLGNTHNPLW